MGHPTVAVAVLVLSTAKFSITPKSEKEISEKKCVHFYFHWFVTI